MKKVITKQGIFSHVYRFLVKQGQRAIGPEGYCEYRVVRDGKVLACAAGCLVSDKEAAKLFSGDWDDQNQRAPTRFKAHEDFIQELQRIHDRDFRTMSSFKNSMASFATLHGLTVPEDV